MITPVPRGPGIQRVMCSGRPACVSSRVLLARACPVGLRVQVGNEWKHFFFLMAEVELVGKHL